MSSLQELKEQLADQLCTPEQVKHPEGVATGLEALDRYLFWSGIPKGALTLFSGPLGTGATSLWLEAASRTVNAGKWVVWINRDVPLSPLPLKQKGINLGHFVSIEAPTEDESNEKTSQNKIFWLLQELMSSSLFELVGCDLGDKQLKDHQLRKLQSQARDSNVALVFFTQAAGGKSNQSRKRTRGTTASIFSLIVSFQKKQIVIERALHRPTPHTLPRSVSYARFVLDSNFCAPSGDFISTATDKDSMGGRIGSSSANNSDKNAVLETPRTSRFGS